MTARAVLHSYALREYPREHVFRIARAGRWQAVELAACHLDPADPKRDLAAAVDQARWARVELHCAGYWGMFADRSETTRRETIDAVHRLIDACAATGVGFVNGSGGWLVRDPDDWDTDWRRNGSAFATATDCRRVAAAYRELAEHAGSQGIRIGVEIHPNTVHDTAAATARLLRLVDRPELTVTVDPSNAAALSEADRHPEVLDLLEPWPVYFHLKNCVVRDGVADFSVDVDGGVIDNDRWLKRLVRSGRCTAVSAEYCGDDDPHPRLVAAHRYLTGVLASLPECTTCYRPVSRCHGTETGVS